MFRFRAWFLLGLGICVVGGAALGLEMAAQDWGLSEGSSLSTVIASHVYPSPSGWPGSVYPGGTPHPQPSATVAPCPEGEVAIVAVYRGHIAPACQVAGGLPPDPGTGPLCAGPPGRPDYLPIREPDGSYDCG